MSIACSRSVAKSTRRTVYESNLTGIHVHQTLHSDSLTKRSRLKKQTKKKRLPTAFPLKLRHDRETSNSRSPQEKTNLHMNTSHFSWDG